MTPTINNDQDMTGKLVGENAPLFASQGSVFHASGVLAGDFYGISILKPTTITAITMARSTTAPLLNEEIPAGVQILGPISSITLTGLVQAFKA